MGTHTHSPAPGLRECFLTFALVLFFCVCAVYSFCCCCCCCSWMLLFSFPIQSILPLLTLFNSTFREYAAILALVHLGNFMSSFQSTKNTTTRMHSIDFSLIYSSETIAFCVIVAIFGDSFLSLSPCVCVCFISYAILLLLLMHHCCWLLCTRPLL